MIPEPASIWDLGAELGEGPIWFDDRLWFVDIKKQQIHRFDPASGERRSWLAPEQVGFIVPRERGGLVAGLQSGLFVFDPNDGGFEPIVAVEPEKPGNRLNDATVDAQGRLWFGTMDNGEREKSGAFYCYADGALHTTGIDNISITNGPALSPDGRRLYWVDTLGGQIWVAAVEHDGTLADSRPFISFRPEEGYPDGPTVDAEGCVWIGLYAGWQARRYSPSGKLLQSVAFPVANITKVAFGGADRRMLFATTARQLLSAEQIGQQPQAGDLFALPIDVQGQPCFAVRD